MGEFRQYLEVWDEADFRRRHEFAELKLDLSGLPEWVKVTDTHPGVNDSPPLCVSVEFTRNNSQHRYQTNVLIPCGKGQPVDPKTAEQMAMHLVEKNRNRYTRVWVFRRTKFTGKGIYSDESDREYYS
jgi:hypothetical protein